MNRPRILLDIDGVACDFVTPVIETINEIMGTQWTESHIVSWDIMTSLEVPPRVVEMVDDVIKTKGFCRNLKIYPEARAGVDELREFADVYPVTAPFDSPHWITEREAWIVQELGFSRRDITFTDAKHICSGDILIDDKTSTLVRWKEHQSGTAILFDQPWNRRDNFSCRALGWEHLLPVVRSYLGVRL